MKTKGLPYSIILILVVSSIFLFTNFLFSAPKKVSTYKSGTDNIPNHLKKLFKRMDPLPPPYAPDGSYGYSLPPVEPEDPADDYLFLLEGFLLSEPANIIAKFNGQNANDYSGYSLSRAGDINSDGVEDIIIGAWGYSGGSAKGRSYLIFSRSQFQRIRKSFKCRCHFRRDKQ